MLDFAATGRVAVKPESAVSLWGCKPDMLQAGFEHLCLGNLRFTSKGTREVACCHVDSVFRLAEVLAEKTGKAPVVSEKYSVLDLVEHILLNSMGETGLAAAETVGLKAFRCTCGPGTVMFIPAAFAVVERGLGSDLVCGFRTHVIESQAVPKSFATLEAQMLKYSSVDKNAVLKTFSTVRDLIKLAVPLKLEPAVEEPAALLSHKRPADHADEDELGNAGTTASAAVAAAVATGRAASSGAEAAPLPPGEHGSGLDQLPLR